MIDEKPGEETTEYAVARGGSTWGLVMQIVGVVLSVGAAVAESLGADTRAGIIVGAVVVVLGTFEDVVSRLGYVASRTVIKAAERE